MHIDPNLKQSSDASHDSSVVEHGSWRSWGEVEAQSSSLDDVQNKKLGKSGEVLESSSLADGGQLE